MNNDEAPIVASYLVRIFFRSDSPDYVPPTLAVLEEKIESLQDVREAEFGHVRIIARAERVDK